MSPWQLSLWCCKAWWPSSRILVTLAGYGLREYSLLKASWSGLETIVPFVKFLISNVGYTSRYTFSGCQSVHYTNLIIPRGQNCIKLPPHHLKALYTEQAKVLVQFSLCLLRFVEVLVQMYLHLLSAMKGEKMHDSSIPRKSMQCCKTS